MSARWHAVAPNARRSVAAGEETKKVEPTSEIGLRLGVHDLSRLEWVAQVGLPTSGTRKYQVEFSLEIPWNLYSLHNVWDHKQSYTRLQSPAEEGDLLVDVCRIKAGSVRLDGQILLAQPQEAPIFEASVTGAGLTVRTKDGDELGRFSLRDVPERRCQLKASNGLITIVADLDLDPGGDQP